MKRLGKLSLIVLGGSAALLTGCGHSQEHKNLHEWADTVQAYLLDDDEAMRYLLRCVHEKGMVIDSTGLVKCEEPPPGRTEPPDSLPSSEYP